MLKKYNKPRYINDGTRPKNSGTSVSTVPANHDLDEILFDEGGQLEDDAMLGLDHLDRTRTVRNGAEMFLR